VVLADVGLGVAYGSRVACLVITGQKAVAVHRGVELPLPTSSSEMLAYLKKAAGHDPAPSPLLAVIRAIESSGGKGAQLAVADDQPRSSGQ
jgi:hypothetical protein